LKLLAVDTATMRCGVGVYRDGSALSEQTHDNGRTHSVRLMNMIDRALDEAGLRLKHLDGLAVGTGPGSFTGLRIGISTIKGLAVGSGIPVVGVCSLKALALQAGMLQTRVHAMIDARKNQVYSGIYEVSGKGPKQLCHVQVAAPEQVASAVKRPELFIGSGAVLYRDFFRRALGDQVQFAAREDNDIRAGSIALLAEEKFRRKRIYEAGTIIPDYVRKSDAEINYPKGLPTN